MSLVVSQAGPSGRAGELALWSVAGLLMLSVHIGAAALLMQETPDAPADNSPPAAIMIELAPEPEAVNTEEDQISPDQQDQEEVKSEQTEPAEEPQPEPVIEEPPREMPEPEPQITQTIPEPPPEPVEEIDPIEEQMTAALENVEVPLPMMRPEPPKPDEAKKPEPRKEQAKRTQKPKQQQQQARQDMAEAKVQARQSDRTAASQNSAGFFSQSISPAKWKSRVQAKLARTARRCPGDGTGTAAVRFSFDGRGNVTSVSLSRSSGDSAIDSYIISAVRRASPIPAPPSGVASYLDQALTCL
ncbi:TonB family protein [Neorhizobium sp. Rsf11]|uniref:TonB family protein n=1 Tax=Neorhizobium phenanthreniclasticum TaxID=3157917 RepID=A0ABV0M9F5_9HYPH